MEYCTGDFNSIASLSGVTTLKNMVNLNRIGGSAQYTLSPELKIVKKQPQTKDTKTQSKAPNETRTREYSINAKEIRHRIQLYIRTKQANQKAYFWTITFPEGLPDKLCYKAFNIFLTRLRTEQKLKAYIWVAERQQNETVHFHMIVHQYLNVQKTNRYMRASLMTLNKTLPSKIPPKTIKNYNGVDIAKNRKTKRVVNFAKGKQNKALQCYLTKYVTKNQSSFSHLAWHCSREYSNLATKLRLTYAELIETPIYQRLNLKNPYRAEFFIHYNYQGNAPEWLINFLTTINNKILHLMEQEAKRAETLANLEKLYKAVNANR